MAFKVASLMSLLLQKDPSRRLGSEATGGFAAIKSHPFFRITKKLPLAALAPELQQAAVLQGLVEYVFASKLREHLQATAGAMVTLSANGNAGAPVLVQPLVRPPSPVDVALLPPELTPNSSTYPPPVVPYNFDTAEGHVVACVPVTIPLDWQAVKEKRFTVVSLLLEE